LLKTRLKVGVKLSLGLPNICDVTGGGVPHDWDKPKYKVGLLTAVGPFQGILGADILLWARPNCLLGFPNGMSRLKHGEDHGAWNYPLVLGLLRIVFLGVTIYPKEVVRGGCLK
jgi:hypothetical protein